MAEPVDGGRRSGRAVAHEQNKRSVVELTAWAAVLAAVLVVGLHAGISATASTADVPRVTPAEYQYR